MIFAFLLATSMAVASAGAADSEQAPTAETPEDSFPVKLSGAPMGYAVNAGKGNWEAFSFVVQNDETEAVSMTLCPDKISRYSIENPEQEREFSFAISTGKGRWTKSCKTYLIEPGAQLVRHAYFKFGKQDGSERLFVIDTNLAQITFVARRVQNGAPSFANFQ